MSRIPLILVVIMCMSTDVVTAHEWKMWGSLKTPRAFGYVAQVSPTAAIVVGGFPDFRVDNQNFGTWVTRSCEILDVKTGTSRYTDSTKVGHADGAMIRMSNGHIVVLGGITDGKSSATTLVEEFDPQTEKWTTRGNLALKRRQQQAIAIDDHRIMVVGGRGEKRNLSGTSDVEIFDLSTGICYLPDVYPNPLTNHKLMMVDSNVYVIGGRKAGPNELRYKDVYYYDEAADAWKYAFDLPRAMPLIAGIQVYGGMFVSGGSTNDGDSEFSDAVYFIDGTKATALTGKLPTGVKGHGFAAWVNDTLITFGGEDNAGGSATASSWIDTKTASVFTGPELNIGRRYGMSVDLPGDKVTPACVFAIAGVLTDNKVTSTIEILTSSGCSESSVASLLNPQVTSLTGSAEFTQTPSVMLTSTTQYSAGGAWYNPKVSVRSGLSTSFSFRMMDGSDNAQPDGGYAGADGFAFVIQNSTPRPRGEAGQGIGYEDIPNALAVEFDAYLNAAYSDPSTSHIALQAQRDRKLKPWHRPGHLLGITQNVPSFRSDGTIYYARIDFLADGVDIYLDTVPTFKDPVLSVPGATIPDMISLGLDGNAWIGITSATGFSSQQHELLSWSIDACEFLAVGVSEEEDQKAELPVPVIFPSPSTDQAVIRCVGLKAPSSVTIYDVSGRSVWTKVAGPEEMMVGVALPMTEIQTGLYVVQVLTGQSLQSVKWMVQR